MQPLRIGPLTVDVPVVLAPMAGVTNVPFRTLCRRHGGGLFVSEMVGARALLEAERVARRGTRRRRLRGDGAASETALAAPEAARDGRLSDGRARTALRAAFAPDERPRSLQLYAVDPAELGAAVELLAARGAVDHVDLNVGCPAAAVTRHGGGAALPWRVGLLHDLVAAAVEAARANPAADGTVIPVTVKMRMGIDRAHLTYLDAGRAARDAGAAAVTLHGRTAYDAYAGRADWGAIASLVAALPDLPVLGNGDIWVADDAVAMIARTGCAGVVVGRGCLGRPWLFRDLEAALAGRAVPPPPTSGEVVAMLRQHAELLTAHLGEGLGCRELRKHTSWYLQGFEVGRATRKALRQVATLAELDELLQTVDPGMQMPDAALTMRRGHTHGPKPVKLPHGWLSGPRHGAPSSAAAAMAVSGG